MKKLVIAEKPSVALSIAKVLNATNKTDGYYENDDYIVSWCVGHLVGLATPEVYDEKYKNWDKSNLPILPEKFIFKINETTKKQFHILKALMNRTDVKSLICATDAGREGELIFRHVYNMANCSKLFERLWISSLEDKAIKDGFNSLKSGLEYNNLYHSALCREEADWLVGINFTRLFTALYNSNSVLSIGRVQTPTLAMICKRAEEIANFKKEKYYIVHILFNGINATSEKITDKATADEIARACVGEKAVVEYVTKQNKALAQPKLFDLTSLQREANKIFGYTAKQTLEYTQSLYEKKLVTYPRTDSQYLTDDMYDTAQSVISCVFNTLFNDFEKGNINIPILLNSKKVSDHHAIIPTVEISNFDISTLPDSEKNILNLIALRLICATGDKHIYEAVKAEFICNSHTFIATGKTVITNGWKYYEKAFKNKFKVNSDEAAKEEAKLPELESGMTFNDVDSGITEHFTQPPKQYTEDTLLSAMERAGNDEYDTDEVERKGLGTPATRAGIIETLINREYIERQKKNLVPTQKGIQLIKIAPEKVKSASLTAEWENKLVLIGKGEYSSQIFMQEIGTFIDEIIYSTEADKSCVFENRIAEVLGKCPKCGSDVVVGKYGAYCKNKCGISLNKAFGINLSKAQIKKLLNNERILLKGIDGKNGKFDAYLTPDGINEFNYTNKEGKAVKGYQLKYKMEFPKKK